MAVRQHILPRFLLKGFASRVNKNEIYTWVYKKEGQCYETNIINVAVEKYFYGEEGDGTVDDKITDIEGRFATLLEDLRDGEENIEIKDQRIAEFITHLEVRTKHMRESFRESTEVLFDELMRYISDYKNLKQLIFQDPEIVDKIARDSMANFPSHIRENVIFMELVRKMMPMVLDQNREQMMAIMAHVRKKVKENYGNIIKNGHIKGLEKTQVPEPRVEHYLKLRWFVCNSKTELILGDVGCLFEVVGKKQFISITFKNDKILNVYLPITDKKMLVGTSLQKSPDLDSESVNLETVKLSREFFVSSARNASLEELSHLIGQNSWLATPEELREIAYRSLMEKVNSNQ